MLESSVYDLRRSRYFFVDGWLKIKKAILMGPFRTPVFDSSAVLVVAVLMDNDQRH